jgi:hypothetical protein
MIGTLLYYLVSKLTLLMFNMIGDRFMMMEEHLAGRDDSTIDNKDEYDDIDDEIIDEYDDNINYAASDCNCYHHQANCWTVS